MAFVDACWFTSGSSGTADFADGTALSAFRNMAGAGAADGEVYSYRAESIDRTQWEMGYGAYSSGGNTLARTVTASSAGGTTKVDFSAAPIVSLQPLARDFGNAGDAVPVGYADLLITVSLLALQVADNTNVALFLGPSGNRYADSFDALTYFDAVNSVNVNTSVAGLLKPTTIVSTEQSATTDNQTNTAGFAYIERGWAINVSTTLSHFRVYSNTAFSGTARVVERTGAGSYTNRASAAFSHTGSGWEEFAVSYAVPSSGDFYVAIYSAGTPSGQRSASENRAFISGDITTSVTGATEFGSGLRPTVGVRYAGTTNNMTAYLGPFTAASAVTVLKALLRVKEVDAATAGTDYTVRGSTDNKANWFNIPLTELYTAASPVAAIRVVEGAETDTSAHSSTTVWLEIKTLNNKMVEIHDLYSYWK